MVIIICGATATGKTGLALEIGRRLGTTIVSADSRQVYREFDIGTAKPTVAERKLVPHVAIDTHEPTQTITVADYQDLANSTIAACQREGKIPLLVGGTGLYIKAIVKGLKIPRVPPQPELRSQLDALGQKQCYQMLQAIDPIAAMKIHANDRPRTQRALEVFYTTGKPVSEQQGEAPPSYPFLQIGLRCRDVATGDDRICQRTQKMLADGWIAEVERIVDKYGWDLPLLDTLGYRELKRYLRGELDLPTATAEIDLHTRQFAKRQRTWFNAIPEIEWYDGDHRDLIEIVWKRICNWSQNNDIFNI
jgi:tRNA dimethylallyltransferase